MRTYRYLYRVWRSVLSIRTTEFYELGGTSNNNRGGTNEKMVKSTRNGKIIIVI